MNFINASRDPQALLRAIESDQKIRIDKPSDTDSDTRIFKITAPTIFPGHRVLSWIRNAVKRRDENQKLRQAVVTALKQTYASDSNSGIDDILKEISTAKRRPLRHTQVRQIIDKLKDRSVGTAFIDKNLQAPATKLGSGAVNTVYLATWNVDNTSQTMVFKADQAESGEFQAEAQAIGIDEKNPRMAERNLATYAVAERLGLDVIPATQRARHQGQLGTVMAKAEGVAMQHNGSFPVHLKLAQPLPSRAERTALFQTLQGIAHQHGMEIVTPTSGCIPEDGKVSVQIKDRAEKEKIIANKLSERQKYLEEEGLFQDPEQAKASAKMLHDMRSDLEGEMLTSYVQWDDPVLREKTTELQWLDCLCGQADRHTGNIVVDYDPSTGKPLDAKGIDNDVSFGVHSSAEKANAHIDEDNRSSTDKAVQSKYPKMPRVISETLKQQFIKWAETSADEADSLENTLKTFLSDAEVKQTRSRLTEIVKHLENAEVKVIGAAGESLDWPDEEVGNLMGLSTTAAPQNTQSEGVLSYMHTHLAKALLSTAPSEGQNTLSTGEAQPSQRSHVVNLPKLIADLQARC